MKRFMIAMLLISVLGCGNEQAGTSPQATDEESLMARQEIAALLDKEAKASAAWEGRDDFRITRSRFYMHRLESGTDQPIVELDITNDTAYTVSRANFSGLLVVTGKASPRYEGPFSCQIPGGIEPGESVHWNMALEMDSYWAGVEVPEGGVFTVKVTGLEDADGATLFADDFSDGDAKRLTELLAKYPDFKG